MNHREIKKIKTTNPLRDSIITLLWLLLIANNSHTQEAYNSPSSIKGAQNIQAEELIRIFQRSESLPTLIDSRIPHDHAKGYIEGAINLPDEITTCKRLKERVPTKNSQTIFYCNGPKCKRSGKAIKIAVQCGYDNLYWFRGGINEWQLKNYPLLRKV